MKDSKDTLDADPSELLPLMRYLNVLVRKYPKPVTPLQLSRFSKVSLAAVSKIRERLFPICDQAGLASTRRKLLLKNDIETVARVGFTFYIDSDLGTFLGSPYAQTFLRKAALDLHSRFVNAIPRYESIFDRNDALFLESLGARVITEVLDDLPKVSFRDFNSESLRAFILNQVIQAIDKLWPILALQLNDSDTLEHILAIRDKVWYMGRDIAKIVVPTALAALLSALPDDATRETYLAVYLHTTDFYLGKVLSERVTDRLRKAVIKINVPWKESYNLLGGTFSPILKAKFEAEQPSSRAPTTPSTIPHSSLILPKGVGKAIAR